MALTTKRERTTGRFGFGRATFPLFRQMAQVVAFMLFAQSVEPPALAAQASRLRLAERGGLARFPSEHGTPGASAQVVSAGSAAVGAVASDLGLVLTPLSTAFNAHVGIDHHQQLRKVVVASNSPAATPHNFDSLDEDGTHRPFSNAAGLTGGLRIATARDDGEGVSRGGFRPGELFAAGDAAGIIVRVAPDGSAVQNPWATLPGGAGQSVGGLFVDRTGVFGGDLIAVTTSGEVWRIDSAGVSTRVTDLGTPLTGVTTVPDDAAKYGPWAGKILAGAEEQGTVYAIDQRGNSTSHRLGVSPSDIRVIPPRENFYGVDPAGRKIWGAPDDAFAGFVGDILIAQGEPGVLARVRWNGSAFGVGRIAEASSWGQITFSPAGLAEIAGVKQFYEQIAVVRHAPQLDGGRVVGALWQLLAEKVELSGADAITSDLLVPGTPTVTVSGRARFGGVVEGVESRQPSGYSVAIGNDALLRHLVTRTDPIELVPVSAPPPPPGTRDVTLSRAGEGFGDPSTLRDLSISGKAGEVSVAPGSYGKFSASGQTSFVFGVQGSDAPAVYNLEELSMSGDSELRVIGPVRLNVRGDVSVGGCSTVGAANYPRRLLLQIAQGVLNVSGYGVLNGVVRIPRGVVSVVGSGRVRGTVMSDRLNVRGNGVLQVTEGDVASPPINQPPAADAGPDQTVTLPANVVSLNGSSSDDGRPAGGVLKSTWSKVSGPGPVAFAAAANVTTATFNEPGVYVIRLTVSDSMLTASDETRIEVVPRNQPPAVNAGADQSVELPNATTLSGTVTDDGLPRGSAVAKLWSVVSGPGAVTFRDPRDVSTAVTFSAPGAYTLRLTAADTEFTADDEVVVTVRTQNRPPAVSAGPDQTVRLPRAVSLNGTATDDGLPAGGRLTATWTKVSGPGAVTFADGGSPATTARFNSEGKYVLRLTASDTRSEASDECTVTVLPGNKPPVVSAGPDREITLLEAATLSGTAADDGLPAGSVLEVAWEKVSGPGAVIFTTPDRPVTAATFSTPGTYVLRLTGDDTQSTARDEAIVVVRPRPHAARVYTLDADFDEGSFINVARGTPDQLQLDETARSFNFIWVAVSSKGTIVKINTETGAILGEYYTSPQGEPRNPSRTTVDHNGNVWATNRDGNSVVHVGLAENGQCVDRNGNGRVDTSAGFGDLRPWTNASGVDTNGGVTTAEDECVLHYTRVNSSGTRHVSVTRENDVWVSGTEGRRFDLIDGKTGLVKRSEPSVNYGGYGGLLDKSGVIWSSRPLLRWDTALPLTGPNGVNWRGYNTHDSYGLCIDSRGNVWNTSLSGNSIYKFAPDGTHLATYGHGANSAQGCVVDKNDDVWVAHSIGDVSVGHLKNDGTFVGNVRVGSGPTGVAVDGAGKVWATNHNDGTVARINPALGPVGGDGATRVGEVDFTTPPLGGVLYNYSDMTGSTLTGAPNNGTWSVVFDSRRAGAEWGRIGWTARVCGDGLLSVSLATGEDGTSYGQPRAVSNGDDPEVPDGRYARVTVRFERASSGESPVLYDLSVGTVGFPLDAPTNVEPGVDAGPDQIISGTNKTALRGSVCDDALPSNRRLTNTWSKVGGPGEVAFADQHSPRSEATFSEAGSYVLRLTATDTEHTVSDTLVVNVNRSNQPPTVNAGPDQSITLPDAATLAGTITDDGLPTGAALASTWSVVSGPGPVTFAASSSPSTTATFVAPGTYVLRLTASDTETTANDTLVIVVNPAPINQPPAVNAGPDIALNPPAASAALGGTIRDDGLPRGGGLMVAWAKVSGPGEVTFGDPNRAATTVTLSAPGAYVLRLTATDSELSSSDEVVVVLHGTNRPPVVAAGPDREITLPNGAALAGSAADDGLPAGRALAVTWSLISGPGTATFADLHAAPTQVSFSAAGTYVLRLTADDSELAASDDVTVVVNAAQPPPTVAISSPADGAEITSRTTFVGTVSGGSSWRLEYSPGGSDGGPSPVWTTIASGSTPVTGGPLGTFDPTLLLNGTYTVRLVAANAAGETAVTSVTAAVEGNQKIGSFSVSFDDLIVPVAGVPIEIVRTYDSRDRRAGDFGAGWTLGIKNVRVEKSGILGTHWEETREPGFLPTYILRATRPRVVTITFPDNRVYKFRAVAEPESQTLLPIEFPTVGFVAMPGTRGSLAAEDSSETLVVGSTPGRVELYSAGEFELYNPTAFRLTTEDGTVYHIDQHAGLRRAVDRNGNTLTITRDGITHSSGKSIAFARDAAGRITRITDPAGNALSYSYDADGDLAAVTDREGRTTTFGYDSAHGLLTIKDPRGVQPLRNEYDAAGRLVRQIDAFGKAVNFTNDLDARQEVVTDRHGHATVYAYDGRGNIVRVTDAQGGVTVRTYDADDNLLTETNPQGKTRAYTYDARGNKLTETDALGNTYRYTYDAHGQVLTFTDAAGRTSTNTYDADGNLVSTRDALGNTTSATYDERGLVTSTGDALGHVTRFQYDDAGNLMRKIDALGHVTAYTYDANGNRLSESATRTVGGAAETLTTTYQYDRNGRQTKVTGPDGATTETVYDSAGRKIATVDELGRRTSHEYDEMGRLVRTTLPDGRKKEFSYDADGRRTGTVDGAGRVTTYAYDSLGRLERTTYPGGSTASISYDPASRVVATTDERGHTTRYEYDAAGRQTRTIDALGNGMAFGYDANGNRTSLTDSKGQTTRYEYDADNNLTRTVYPDGSAESSARDALGRLRAKTDQAGRLTLFEYDARGNLAKVIDALGGVTRYAYDEAGHLLAQTDANGRTTAFEYDRAGRRTRRTLPLGMAETYAYDAAGNLTARVDFRGKRTTYTYDARDRLLARQSDASLGEPAVTFTYTEAGQRASMSDASGLTIYSYDVRHRLVSKRTPQGVLDYTYDAAGNILSVRSSNAEGVSVDYAYDAANRLTRVADNRAAAGVTSYSYDANSNLTASAYPNGVNATFAYDSLNRLTGLRANKSGLLASYAYTLGAAGHRLSVTEHTGRTVNYTYDALYRLTAESAAGGDPATSGTVSYTYDAVGNRLSRASTVGGVASTASAYDENNRLVGDAYDANGNALGPGGNSFAYDSENRLTSAGGGAVRYVYDGDGNRVAKIAGGVMTRYLVDTNNPTGHAQVVEELRGSAVVRQYTYGRGLISQRQLVGGRWQVSFYGYDGHGSVRYLTDAAGAVTDTYTYDAFGTLVARTGETPNDYLHAGEQFDAAAGLYYLRARYLNPADGRFLTADTFEGEPLDPRTLHRYAYVHGDPVNFTDPTGHFEFTIPGLNVKITIQSGILPSVRAVGSRTALEAAKRMAGRVVRSYKDLKKEVAQAGTEIHHLIEKRLWDRCPELQQIFKHVDDIPSVRLTKEEHDAITALWRATFPYKNQFPNLTGTVTLEEIMHVVKFVYADHPDLLRQVLLALL